MTAAASAPFLPLAWLLCGKQNGSMVTAPTSPLVHSPGRLGKLGRERIAQHIMTYLDQSHSPNSDPGHGQQRG